MTADRTQAEGVLLPRDRYAWTVSVDGAVYRLSAGRSFGRSPSAVTPAHSHAQYELHAAADGACTLVFGERSLTLQGGECCLIRPHVYHMRRAAPNVSVCYDLRLDCPDADLLPPGAPDYRLLRCAPELLQDFRGLANELREHRIGSNAAEESLCTLVVVSLLRELSGPAAPVPVSGAVGDQRDELIDSYFALRFGETATAAALAALLGVTTRQLARIMQRLYGCTFRQRLQETRLYHARQLLSATAQPVWQIAASCGFASVGSFSTAFRAAFGCTPSQFRLRKHGLY